MSENEHENELVEPEKVPEEPKTLVEKPVEQIKGWGKGKRILFTAFAVCFIILMVFYFIIF